MKIRTLLIAAAALALAGCSSLPRQATHHDAAQLAAQADSGLFLTGTLAALGSFEWDAAPLMNDAAIKLHNAAVALKEGRMTVDDAQSVMNQVDRAHDLVTQAYAACAQDSRTAKCTHDEARGRRLLDQARVTLSTVL